MNDYYRQHETSMHQTLSSNIQTLTQTETKNLHNQKNKEKKQHPQSHQNPKIGQQHQHTAKTPLLIPPKPNKKHKKPPSVV